MTTVQPVSRTLLSLVFLLLATAHTSAQESLLVADFEQANYGEWKTTGKAFGEGPIRDALPGQMPLSGFLGKGLVNSYHQGDPSTGTLTSPPFPLRKPYLRFLIGGGKHPGETCINLRIGEKTVRTATDRTHCREEANTSTGAPGTWPTCWGKHPDRNRRSQQGGWGHINVDQIEQAMRRAAC